MTRIAIIGTGLIGTSIAMRLRQSERSREIEVVGCDISRDNARAARPVFNDMENDARRAVRDAGLVVIATPIGAMREVMGDISDRLEPGAVVTDTGSTKTQIVAWAAELLPSTVTFVGGHPMAGKTESGPGNASATLFEGARWVIVAPPRGDAQLALETVQGLAAITGATPMYMDAEEHDAYVAAISHLPLIAATALFRLARSSEAWPELSVLASSGFKDTTRLAGTDEGLAFDIAATNREQLVHWLRRYRAELRDLEEAIDQAEPGEDLLRLFGQANVDYTAFRAGVVGRQEVDAGGRALADVGMTDLLIGGNFAERLRQLRETAARGDDDRGRGEPRR